MLWSVTLMAALMVQRVVVSLADVLVVEMDAWKVSEMGRE